MFREGSKTIQSFPEHLTFTVHGALHRCETREEGRYRNDIQLDSDFMSALQFEAYWKHELNMQKTSVTVVGKGLDIDISKLSQGTEGWKYNLVINAMNTPLTDSLVLLVLDGKGKLVSRLSGKL
jgi:hypothetical protein